MVFCVLSVDVAFTYNVSAVMTVKDVQMLSCGANVAGIGLALNRSEQKEIEFPTTKSPPQNNTESTQDVNANINLGPITNTGLFIYIMYVGTDSLVGGFVGALPKYRYM